MSLISKKKLSIPLLFVPLSVFCSASFADSYPIVQMLKRNADSFALDGNNNGADGQDVYLYSEDAENVNQQWLEVDLGDGYYTYQKLNTEYCLDGGNGGEDRQNLYLWSCSDSNQNQHWLKVDLGDGYYRLEKRNASGYSIDGNNGGEDRQSAYLWSSDDNNQNQQWYFNYIDSGSSAIEVPVIASVFDDGSAHSSYPAENVLDGDTDFASRWAASGSPVNLTIELAELSQVSEVGIAWGRGDSRTYTFAIYARATTDDDWTQVYDAVSSGNEAGIEYYDVTDIDAQQIRITTSKNSAGTDWTDITEVAVQGPGSDDNTEDPVDEYADCIKVSSLADFATYLDVSDQCIRMMPGTYSFDTSNVGEDLLFSSATVLLFTGSNNTFVFDDVTFEYDTAIFQQFGATAINEFQVVGTNNLFQNLTMEDIGDTTPYKTALAVSIDGSDNIVDGFTITTRGSYPYGYGDIFGKGSTRVLNHKKHSGVLIRGDRNTLKGLSLYMGTYGHGVFVQGGDEVLIEDVYVEGELSTVEAVLAEDGTGSDADNVDFLTVWGYHLYELTENYRFSLQEDGIRAYSTGNIYGSDESRDTGSVTVKDSTVKFMRSGVTIGWAKGDKYVENCTTLGVEGGYWVGSDAVVVNSRGDASVGPLFADDVYRDSSVIDLTLLDNAVSKIGNTPSVYLVGDSHQLTLKDGTTTELDDIEIQVGGTRYGHRWLAGSDEEPPYISANGVSLDNQTSYPVVIAENATSVTVQSCGTVDDNGNDSTVSTGTNCN